jgi:hypothetical protein
LRTGIRAGSLGLGLALALAVGAPDFLGAQEAGSGFDARESFSVLGVASNVLSAPPRSGSPVAAGFRSVTYPTWKINSKWTVTGALQLVTRPYFYGDFDTNGYGAKGFVLQSTLNYSRISENGSLVVRAGVISTSFGSFLLRYDDADNPLIDMPPQYGYYYAPVSTSGLPGAQIDVTRGHWDGRLQFANSSPANPRSLFGHDQYGNWAGGAGYTIHQGFRVGVDAYRGPYLDRQDAYFFPGEHNPSTLPATGLGVDASWAHGHTSFQFEDDKFLMTYDVIPDFREPAGYVEFKQVLNPRWYLAFRPGYTAANRGGDMRCVEAAAGFRPNRFQLIKLDYEIEHYTQGTRREENTLAVQWLVTFHKSVASY